MGVTYIPNDDGEQIAKIGSAIADFIDPNRQVKAEARRILATNPKLKQEMADMEHDNPGSLKAMGLGGSIEKAIKLIEPSYQAQINKIIGPQAVDEAKKPEQAKAMIQKLLTGQTPGEAAADKTSQIVSDAFNKFASENPDQAKTLAVLPIIKAQLETAKANKDQLDVQREEQVANSSKYTPEDIDLVGDAKKFYDGKLAPDKSGFYNAYAPALKDAWKQALDVEQFNREASLRTKLANLRENPRDTIDKLIMSKAFTRQSQTNAASPEAYFYYYTGRLMPGGNGKTPTETELQSVRTAEDKATQAERNTQINSVNNDVNALKVRLNNSKDDSEKAETVDRLNTLYRQQSLLGGPSVTAVYGVKPGSKWFNFLNAVVPDFIAKDIGSNVYYLDSEGKLYNDRDQQVAKSQPLGIVKQIADQLMKDPRILDESKRAKALENIKNDPKSAQYYDGVKAILDSTFAKR